MPSLNVHSAVLFQRCTNSWAGNSGRGQLRQMDDIDDILDRLEEDGTTFLSPCHCYTPPIQRKYKTLHTFFTFLEKRRNSPESESVAGQQEGKKSGDVLPSTTEIHSTILPTNGHHGGGDGAEENRCQSIQPQPAIQKVNCDTAPRKSPDEDEDDGRLHGAVRPELQSVDDILDRLEQEGMRLLLFYPQTNLIHCIIRQSGISESVMWWGEGNTHQKFRRPKIGFRNWKCANENNKKIFVMKNSLFFRFRGKAAKRGFHVRVAPCGKESAEKHRCGQRHRGHRAGEWTSWKGWWPRVFLAFESSRAWNSDEDTHGTRQRKYTGSGKLWGRPIPCCRQSRPVTLTVPCDWFSHWGKDVCRKYCSGWEVG